MAIHYRYFGIFADNDPPDDPSGAIRTWNNRDGRQIEKTFGRSLTWEPSRWLTPSTRPDEYEPDEYEPDEYEYVEIGESVAERVVERVTKNITEGRYRSRS